MNEFKLIAEQLTRGVDSLIPFLLPHAQLKGKLWECGNINGEKGQSLKINRENGRFCDYADSSKHGDLLELIKLVKNCTPLEALKFAKNFLGIPNKNKIEKTKISTIKGKNKTFEQKIKTKNDDFLLFIKCYEEGEPLNDKNDFYFQNKGLKEVYKLLNNNINLAPKVVFDFKFKRKAIYIPINNTSLNIVAFERLFEVPVYDHKKMSCGLKSKGFSFLGSITEYNNLSNGNDLILVSESYSDAIAVRLATNKPVFVGNGNTFLERFTPDFIFEKNRTSNTYNFLILPNDD